jgi:fructosamine-3-kinase
MAERYNQYDYSQFKDSKKTYDDIQEDLKKYKGAKTVIHGDPVFTNILINNFGKIKFIDMRGKIKDTLTIHGDYLYDWAKMYQSLIGYDEIHEGKHVSHDYKLRMINIFYEQFVQFYGEKDWTHLKTITKSLLFSLIPLHNNKKCVDYYELIKSIYLNNSFDI